MKTFQFYIVGLTLLACIQGYAQTPSVATKTIPADYINHANKKTITDMGIYFVRLAKDSVFFHKYRDGVSDKVGVNNLYPNLNKKNIYELTDNEGAVYYFMYHEIRFVDSMSVLTSLLWVDNKKPPVTNGFEPISFKIVELDFIQHGTKTLCTIGDSQTWWRYADNLRRDINDFLPDLVFTGSKKDSHLYGHEGEGGNHTKNVLNRLHLIPKADYYTLLIGTNDWQHKVSKSSKNVIKIIRYLQNQNAEAKIFYLTPLPTSNHRRNQFNQNCKNKILKEISKMSNVVVMRLGESFEEEPEFMQKYYLHDGLHLNAVGVKFMAEKIAKEIARNMP